MKSMILWLFRLGVVSAVCMSCHPLDDLEKTDTDGYVSFVGTIGGAVRATVTSFEENDSISVFAFKNGGDFSSSQDQYYASNVKYVYHGSQFIAAKDGISYAGDHAPITFRAIYPSILPVAAKFSFFVNEDQSKENNYTVSDLMVGSTSPTTELIPRMTFKHCLSSVIVDLAFDTIPTGTIQVRLTSLKTNVNVDLASGTFTASGNTGITVITADNGTNSYKAILPPQTIWAGNPFVTIITESGRTYSWKPTTDLALKSGLQKRLRLKVKWNGVEAF